MTWLVWRQHRKQLLFAVAALVVLSAFFIGTGRPMHGRFERAGLPDCLPEAMEAPRTPHQEQNRPSPKASTSRRSRTPRHWTTPPSPTAAAPRTPVRSSTTTRTSSS